MNNPAGKKSVKQSNDPIIERDWGPGTSPGISGAWGLRLDISS